MSRATIEILLATAATSIEVAFTLPGGTGAIPDGGGQFALLQKQSAANGDVGWTRTPKIVNLQYDIAAPAPAESEGLTHWNQVVKTLETDLGNGVMLQHGFETFIRAANFTGVTIPNGKVAAFVGADTVNEVPKIAPMLADGSILPFYTVGLTTEDIPGAGVIGRVTTFGEVHALNTSGSLYGEAWVEGDILYASPTIPGGLTKVEPAPPNVAIIIAAVVKADALNGTLLVRPSLFPRLQYGTFGSSVSQTQIAVNTPLAATFNVTNISSGVSLGTPSSRVVCSAAGLYQFHATLQLEKTSSSIGLLYSWARVNGADIPNSGGHTTIAGNGTVVNVTRSFTLQLAAGDYFELMWAVDTTTLYLHAHAATAFSPSIPSAALAVAKINQ